jgi:acyl-[acyl-carrier-protein]-phospholipid O-acyltransferase/long-chain-fatty-acid--[acyl-carrier-protein] ligase
VNGSSYLSLTGALFAVPYLLFSGYAGRLTDVLSKRTVLMLCKLAEILVMVAGLLALAHANWIAGLLFILFLTATHSTFFSPAKYGAVPEIVAPRQLTRANGILEATRYAAIILGTAAGGMLMELWRPTPLWIGLVMVLIAVIGFLCSIFIKPLFSAAPARTLSKNPWTVLCEGLKRISRSRSLMVAVASLTFFDAIATLTLLDVLLIGKNEIGLSDVAAGTVGAFAALGAGLGALFCGYLSGPKMDLGITPIAGFGTAVSLLGLGMTAHSYEGLSAWLFVLGVFGGLFVLPFVTWLQKAAGSDERGLIISTSNFVDMAGVLVASAVLAILHDGLGLHPRTILAISGAATVAYVAGILVNWKQLQVQGALLLRSLQCQFGLK